MPAVPVLETHSDAVIPQWLAAELRSDQAGETGAVWIYRGILAVSREPRVRRFAVEHLATESGHLERISAVLPIQQRSRLLALWRVAGFLAGALPALFGAGAVFATVEAVESFVDEHYLAQIVRLEREGILPDIAALLRSCREDELSHRDEARAAQHQAAGVFLRGWCWLVGVGSRAAVRIER